MGQVILMAQQAWEIPTHGYFIVRSCGPTYSVWLVPGTATEL